MVTRKYTRKKVIQDGGAPPKTKEKAKNFAAKPTLYHERSKLSRFFRSPFTSKQTKTQNQIIGKTGFSGNNLTQFLSITQKKANAKELALQQKQRTWLGLRKYTDNQRTANIGKLRARTEARQTAELEKVIRLAAKRVPGVNFGAAAQLKTPGLGSTQVAQSGQSAPGSSSAAPGAQISPAPGISSAAPAISPPGGLVIKAQAPQPKPPSSLTGQARIDFLRQQALNIEVQTAGIQAKANKTKAETVNAKKKEFAEALAGAQKTRETYATTTVALETARRELRQAPTAEAAQAARKEVERLTQDKANAKAEVDKVKPKTFFQRAFSKNKTQNLRQKYNALQRAQNNFSKTTLAGRQQRLNNITAGVSKPNTVKAKGIISGSIDEQLRKAQKVMAQKGLTSNTPEFQELKAKKEAKLAALNQQLPRSPVVNVVAKNKATREAAAADSLKTYLQGRKPEVFEKFEDFVKNLQPEAKQRFAEYKTRKAEQLKNTEEEIQRVKKEKAELEAQLAKKQSELVLLPDILKNSGLSDEEQKNILKEKKNEITNLSTITYYQKFRIDTLEENKKEYTEQLDKLKNIIPEPVVAVVQPVKTKTPEEINSELKRKLEEQADANTLQQADIIAKSQQQTGTPTPLTPDQITRFEDYKTRKEAQLQTTDEALTKANKDKAALEAEILKKKAEMDALPDILTAAGRKQDNIDAQTNKRQAELNKLTQDKTNLETSIDKLVANKTTYSNEMETLKPIIELSATQKAAFKTPEQIQKEINSELERKVQEKVNTNTLDKVNVLTPDDIKNLTPEQKATFEEFKTRKQAQLAATEEELTKATKAHAALEAEITRKTAEINALPQYYIIMDTKFTELEASINADKNLDATEKAERLAKVQEQKTTFENQKQGNKAKMDAELAKLQNAQAESTKTQTSLTTKKDEYTGQLAILKPIFPEVEKITEEERVRRARAARLQRKPEQQADFERGVINSIVTNTEKEKSNASAEAQKVQNNAIRAKLEKAEKAKKAEKSLELAQQDVAAKIAQVYSAAEASLQATQALQANPKDLKLQQKAKKANAALEKAQQAQRVALSAELSAERKAKILKYESNLASGAKSTNITTQNYTDLTAEAKKEKENANTAKKKAKKEAKKAKKAQREQELKNIGDAFSGKYSNYGEAFKSILTRANQEFSNAKQAFFQIQAQINANPQLQQNPKTQQKLEKLKTDLKNKVNTFNFIKGNPDNIANIFSGNPGKQKVPIGVLNLIRTDPITQASAQASAQASSLASAPASGKGMTSKQVQAAAEILRRAKASGKTSGPSSVQAYRAAYTQSAAPIRNSASAQTRKEARQTRQKPRISSGETTKSGLSRTPAEDAEALGYIEVLSGSGN